MSPQEPLKLLSLDGGGIRGISSLLILEHIMEKIRDAKGLEDVPRPCDCFDLIGGTNTGGIIAIMLGRLGLTADECIQAYRNVAQQAFAKKPTSSSPAQTSGAFSAMALENAIKQTIRKFCPEVECRSHRRRGQSSEKSCPHSEMLFRDRTCTKTVVLATTKGNIDTLPTLFRTYDTSATFAACKVWEVARATTAATSFFEPIRIGGDEIEFIDSSFRYNNPCDILIDEGQRQFPERSQMRILSIGTGLEDVVTIEGNMFDIMEPLKEMAASSRKVAAILKNRFKDDGQYYRFNVDRGLQDITLSDWENHSEISTHTRNYLAENETLIDSFVRNFVGKDLPDRKINSLWTNVSSLAERRTEAVHFAVPFERNKSFVGRKSILDRLLELIPPSVEEDICQWTAVVGLGGVGKTQVALEVAFQIRDKHPDCSIFWVPAMNATSFENAYMKIGQLLKIDGINMSNADAKTLVKTALSDYTGSWLLIIDNADDADLLFDDDIGLVNSLPSNRNGSILFTTRNHEIASRLDIPDANILTVGEMSKDESLSLLCEYLNESQVRDVAGTAKLLEVLAYLPLAIRQASAYMAKKRITTTKYLNLCQSSDKNMTELLSRDFDDRFRYKGAKNSIIATWLVSFHQIEEHDPLAADYLKFMSFLCQKDIPQSLLPPAEPIKVEEALGTLKAYAFITEREEADSYDVHRLVQLAMLNWLAEKGDMNDWVGKISRQLAEVYPFPEHENKEIWMRYLPHTQYVLAVKTTRDELVDVGLLSKVGGSYFCLGQYREAEVMYRRALEIREKALGPEHPDTLTSVNNLGLVLQHQGKFEEAEAMYQRALEMQEKVLGPENPDTLTSVSSLGTVLQDRGKFGDAEAMHRRALEIREKVLGPEHPHTLISVNSLGSVLRHQGKFKEAEAMHWRTLEIREKVLGPEHPHTLTSVDDLGSALQDQGKFEEAEAMHRRALEIREKVLGPEHPDTLTSVSSLGSVLQRQGKFEEAEAMHRRALEMREKVLGSEHPDTLASVGNLGLALQPQGKFEKAEAMCRRALGIREKVLGPEHPRTLISISNLGLVLQYQGKCKEAEAMHRRALEIREKVLGPEHPDTLISVSSLGSVLQDRGKFEEAEAMHRRALGIREKVLGPEHPHTLASVNSLGSVLRHQGKFEEAEAMHRRGLGIEEKVLGPEHPRTLISVNNLGSVLQYQGKSDEAEAMHRRALEIQEKVLGPEHPRTLISISNLGLVLQYQGKCKEAEAMHRRALEIREKVLGPENPHTLTSVSSLGSVLQRQGKFEEAEAMHRRALEIREKVLGPEYPDTLISVDNLGSVLQDRSKFEEAEAMYRRVLEVREKVLGPEHPDTLTSVNNLGSVLHDRGKLEEAEAMHRRALEIREKVLGPEHPDTITSVDNLKKVLQKRKAG